MYDLSHRLIIFLFRRKVVFRSQDIQVFVFLAIPRFRKSVTPWWVLVYETGCIFWIYLLNHNSLTHQTWSIDRWKQEKYFSETFLTIWRTGVMFQALFNLATCSNYSIINYVKIPVFHFFEKVNKWHLKMVNVNY